MCTYLNNLEPKVVREKIDCLTKTALALKSLEPQLVEIPDVLNMHEEFVRNILTRRKDIASQ